jgi:hypothetical protein
MPGERAFNIVLTIAGDHDGRHGTAWPSGQSWRCGEKASVSMPSCLCSLQFTQSILANGFGLTDAGHYIIRDQCHCVVMSDPMEPCPTWHV